MHQRAVQLIAHRIGGGLKRTPHAFFLKFHIFEIPVDAPAPALQGREAPSKILGSTLQTPGRAVLLPVPAPRLPRSLCEFRTNRLELVVNVSLRRIRLFLSPFPQLLKRAPRVVRRDRGRARDLPRLLRGALGVLNAFRPLRLGRLLLEERVLLGKLFFRSSQPRLRRFHRGVEVLSENLDATLDLLAYPLLLRPRIACVLQRHLRLVASLLGPLRREGLIRLRFSGSGLGGFALEPPGHLVGAVHDAAQRPPRLLFRVRSRLLELLVEPAYELLLPSFRGDEPGLALRRVRRGALHQALYFRSTPLAVTDRHCRHAAATSLSMIRFATLRVSCTKRLRSAIPSRQP